MCGSQLNFYLTMEQNSKLLERNTDLTSVTQQACQLLRQYSTFFAIDKLKKD